MNNFRISLGWLAVMIAAGLGVGCQSKSPTQYISPRLEGRVLDAQTRQPVEGVTVRRVVPGQSMDDSHGGEAIEQTPAFRSHPDGTFVLGSERDVELFRRSGWYSVTFAFAHAGYFPFTTNYTVANATLMPTGEPVVQAGDILLTPRKN